MNGTSRTVHKRKWLLLPALLVLLVAVSGCRTLSYYAQAIKGQYQIFANRKAIEELIASSNTSPELKQQLQLVQQIRAFAAAELKLAVDDHYSSYVDVRRKYVVWNVQAAPRFSLEPKRWWYPFVGSLEYRGYFSEQGAREYAGQLQRDGWDVYVTGVDAYSTLGWFKDPVLNTFVFRDEAELAEVLFHELAHQRVFARGDTDFNEAFATTVGQEGARRWLQASGNTNALEEYFASRERNEQFVRLIMKTRGRLEELYGDTRDEDGRLQAARTLPAPVEQLAEAKARVFDELRSEYQQLKQQWGGFSGYDAWFARELNNAQLNTIANYYDYVPGFQALLKRKGGDLEAFYRAVEELADKPREERHEWLRVLAADPELSWR